MIDLLDLTERIRRHEGLRLKPYKCPTGHLTIGYGRNLEAVGITESEAEALLKNDVDRAVRGAHTAVVGFEFMSDDIQEVLVEMCFQMGPVALAGFRRMIAALGDGNRDAAASEMLDSQWARQTPQRAAELAAIVRGS